MSLVVVDASIAVMWFAQERDAHDATRLLTGEHDLIAPDLMFLETTAALCRKRLLGEIDGRQLDKSIRDLSDAAIGWTLSHRLIGTATRLAVQTRHHLFDCLYLALALERGALLATNDSKLGRLAAAITPHAVRLWQPTPTSA